MRDRRGERRDKRGERREEGGKMRGEERVKRGTGEMREQRGGEQGEKNGKKTKRKGKQRWERMSPFLSTSYESVLDYANHSRFDSSVLFNRAVSFETVPRGKGSAINARGILWSGKRRD